MYLYIPVYTKTFIYGVSNTVMVTIVMSEDRSFAYSFLLHGVVVEIFLINKFFLFFTV